VELSSTLRLRAFKRHSRCETEVDQLKTLSERTIVLAMLAILTGCGPRPSPVALAPNQKAPPVDPKKLAKEIGFPETLVLSLQQKGANMHRLVGMDANGNDKPAAGLVMDVAGADWHDTVVTLRKEAPAGYLVFCYELGFGMRPDQFAVLRGKDQFDILRAVGTDGANYNIMPDQVLARVKEWDKRYGLDIQAAGQDWMEARFKAPPAEMDAFAREVYKFCPDVVDQGTGSVEELAREMTKTNSVYLWWD
jgi:hypothetical protein